jgi:ParB-like nuclease domain
MSKSESEVTKMRPADIKIGNRVRKDFGDIDELVRDIEEIGLLQPVVVSFDDTLIAGARRLQAWSRSSHARDPIPVHRVDLAAIVRGEFSENTMRKNFTISEMVAMKRAMEPLVKAAAKLNQRKHGGTAPGRKSTATTKLHTGATVAKYCGISRRSLEKAEAVISASERSPSRFGPLVSEMDRTGKVDGVFNKLSSRTQGFSRKDRSALGLSIFSETLLPARTIGSATCRDVIRNARFWRYLAEHIGVPPNHAMTVREFVKTSLIREAFDYADQKEPTG